MAKQSQQQKKTVGRVMHEFKHGELKSGSGGKVKNPRQAIAVALSEAGASKRKSPKQNKRSLAKTKSRERGGRTAQARSEGRSGRSGRRPSAKGRSASTRTQRSTAARRTARRSK
jgi:hypothetical protein